MAQHPPILQKRSMDRAATSFIYVYSSANDRSNEYLQGNR
jgi:hypothetical protein